jgi:hypothetical protein
MPTDFIQELTDQINQLLGEKGANSSIEPEQVKQMVIKAADETLLAATRGEMKNTHLVTKEVGYVVASLMFDQKGFNRGGIFHPRRRK